MLTLYRSFDTKYHSVEPENIQPAKNEFIASLPERPENHLNRATIARFSKQSEIPVNQLDRVLLAMVIGSYRDPVTVYKDLQRMKWIKAACEASGITWQQLTNFAKRKD